MDLKEKESIETLVFKRSMKLDLMQAIDNVIQGLVHPAALETLSLSEREEFTNMVIKIAEKALDEIKVEIKERARLVTQAYREQEEMNKNLKKMTGNRPVN